jgi:hypothetical protein
MASRRTTAPKSPLPKRPGDPRTLRKHPAPTEDDLVASLAGRSTGVDDAALAGIFGADLGELRRLADAALSNGRRRGGSPRVYLLHGIMGSELGVRRRFWEDVIWLGLTDVLLGNLRKLRLGPGGDPGIHPLGFLPGVYLMMRLQLEAAGFEVVPHVFDWRRGLAELGSALSEQVAREKGRVMIVAHSMGGLVARAAFRAGMRKVARFVMLAVPNHGSLAPVEALRGQYGLARLIAGADPVHDAEGLARDVFSTFPGLYQLILDRRLHPGLDLFEAGNWPSGGPQPDRKLLSAAGGVERLLAVPADTPGIPWHLIAGTGQQTRVAARVAGGEFQYRVTSEGDGTVPLESALLPGVQSTFFTHAGHGFFANHKDVRAATVDLLRNGDTMVLSRTRPQVPRGGVEQWVAESDLQAVATSLYRTRPPQDLSHAERLRILFGGPVSVVPAPEAVAGPPAGSYLPRLEQVTIGRRKQRRLEVAFYNGSITDVSARAYVLGTFLGVTPSGAAGALDALMDGAIAELVGHNMFGSRTGEVFILPLAQREVRAEMGVFVGMGSYDKFKAVTSPAPQVGARGTRFYLHGQHVPALEIAAENAARMMARTKVDDFATVLLGGTVAEDLAASSESMLRGFLRGLEEADHGQGIRRLVICETNPERFHAMRRQIVDLAATPLCEGVEFVFSELDPPPEVQRLRALGISTSVPRTGPPEPVYLLVRTEAAPQAVGVGATIWRTAFLGPSNRAAVREGAVTLTAAELVQLLSTVTGDAAPEPEEIGRLGRQIAERLLPEHVLSELSAVAERPLVILHDAEASKIPWEALWVPGTGTDAGKDRHPSLRPGMSRRFLADASVCARWPTPARRDARIDMLLISNPTGDLAGAEQEAALLEQALASHSRFKVDHSLRGNAATRSAVLEKLASGRYDIVHFAGHAFFDPANRDLCGLQCAHGEVLTGRDVAGIAKLPFLLVLNACQSLRTRRSGRGPAKAEAAARKAAHTIAETMLCSGIANLIGTYWPVGDESARRFAVRFYRELLAEKLLGEAVMAARGEIKQGSSDWANYALFGNPLAGLSGA